MCVKGGRGKDGEGDVMRLSHQSCCTSDFACSVSGWSNPNGSYMEAMSVHCVIERLDSGPEAAEGCRGKDGEGDVMRYLESRTPFTI
uniref:Uncharacterized protein n=1 Tax=Pristionchus pacificus TaxID=54126 RepID=A0A2A6B8J3_PRIPA|eukprot:PDM62173.1 hypothetical protein PRIPAC_51615 [Pristionchus pacificus]